jgi:hypothetical protein
MIVLDSTTQITMTVSSGANVVETANFVDVPSTPNYNVVSSNGTSPVTVVPAPESGNRLVQHVDIYNGDPLAQIVSVFFGGTQLIQQSVPSGWNMQYTTNGGWSAPTGMSSSYYFPGGW